MRGLRDKRMAARRTYPCAGRRAGHGLGSFWWPKLTDKPPHGQRGTLHPSARGGTRGVIAFRDAPVRIQGTLAGGSRDIRQMGISSDGPLVENRSVAKTSPVPPTYAAAGSCRRRSIDGLVERPVATGGEDPAARRSALGPARGG